jgi:hypothetical protein
LTKPLQALAEKPWLLLAMVASTLSAFSQAQSTLKFRSWLTNTVERFTSVNVNAAFNEGTRKSSKKPQVQR